MVIAAAGGVIAVISVLIRPCHRNRLRQAARSTELLVGSLSETFDVAYQAATFVDKVSGMIRNPSRIPTLFCHFPPRNQFETIRAAMIVNHMTTAPLLAEKAAG